MKYLLDTCVLSELVKPCPETSVMEWLASVPPDAVFLSVLTIGEVRKGIEGLPESREKTRLALWLNTLLDEYRDRILPLDLSVAETWGILQAHAEETGTPMGTIDGLLAATASVHHLMIVTRHASDFVPSHLPLMNPWNE